MSNYEKKSEPEKKTKARHIQSKKFNFINAVYNRDETSSFFITSRFIPLPSAQVIIVSAFYNSKRPNRYRYIQNKYRTRHANPPYCFITNLIHPVHLETRFLYTPESTLSPWTPPFQMPISTRKDVKRYKHPNQNSASSRCPYYTHSSLNTPLIPQLIHL